MRVDVSIDLKTFLTFLIVILFLQDRDMIESVKKNSQTSVVIGSSREDRIADRQELNLVNFANELYSEKEKAQFNYENTATPPRNFSRQAR